MSEGIYTPLSHFSIIKRKLHLIENGVDSEEIDSVNYIANEIKILRTNDVFVIGYIGRLTPGKGLDVLFKAVADYADTNWHVVIIGEGEQDLELKTMVKSLRIEDRITFFGFRSDRIAFLNGFDVFVLPSRSEGTPRCIMEAMSAGVSVVASDIPGCRNLVDGNTTGLLFESDNPKKLADSLKVICRDFKMRERFCEAGKQFIEKNFSAARMAQQYEELFFDLLKLSD